MENSQIDINLECQLDFLVKLNIVFFEDRFFLNVYFLRGNMIKKFLKIFLIIFTSLFVIDWILGVLRFSVGIAESFLKALNVPFGIIAVSGEVYASSNFPTTHILNNEYMQMILFIAMVFLQALLYSVIFWYGRKLWKKIKVSNTNQTEKKITDHNHDPKFSLE